MERQGKNVSEAIFRHPKGWPYGSRVAVNAQLPSEGSFRGMSLAHRDEALSRTWIGEARVGGVDLVTIAMTI